MAIRGINPDSIRQFMVKSDRASGIDANATTFALRTLSAAELAAILDATQDVSSDSSGARTVRVNVNSRNLKLVETSLGGWSNFRDERGNQLSFELAHSAGLRPIIAPRSLNSLPLWLVRELARDIIRDSFLNEDELKNSAASPVENSAPASEAAGNSPNS